MPILKFSNPKKGQVVVFDNVGSEVLGKMVLKDIDCVVLHSRQEVLYLTPQILFGVLVNIKYIGMMRQGHKVGLGCLYRVYLLSCIQYMQPKVVVTFIDNSYSFQLISRIYKKAQFIAIQNGMRTRDCLKDSRPPYPQPGSIISMPMLICFGQYDVDSFRAQHHQIDSYYPSGSLRARYYKDFLSKPRTGPEFDLCLISEWDEGMLSGKYMPNAKKGVTALNDFLSRYIKEEKASLCIALRSDNKKEREYFLDKYGEQITLIRSNREQMSSYEAIDRSAVTFSFYSTLAREAFGWGAKVLACNFSGDDLYDFPCEGFWTIEERDYGAFKKKADHLRAMDPVEYRQLTKEAARYLMNNDSKPPYELARELILRTIGS